MKLEVKKENDSVFLHMVSENSEEAFELGGLLLEAHVRDVPGAVREMEEHIRMVLPLEVTPGEPVKKTFGDIGR